MSTPGVVSAQTPRPFWQMHALGTSATSNFLGAGIGYGRWTGSRVAYQVAVTPGVADRVFAVRSEGFLVFILDPGRGQGVTAYGGGGVAVLAAAKSTESYLLLLIGLEAAPLTRSGWFAEIGLGGGARASIGWRFRS